jgi:hypothetical protein
VPRVFKTVIDVSESEVVERVRSVIMHPHLSDSTLPSPPLVVAARMGRNTEEKIKATRAQHSHHEETRSINCMETRK